MFNRARSVARRACGFARRRISGAVQFLRGKAKGAVYAAGLIFFGGYGAFRAVRRCHKKFIATGRTNEGLTYLRRERIQRLGAVVAIERARILVAMGAVETALWELETFADDPRTMAERARLWLQLSTALEAARRSGPGVGHAVIARLEKIIGGKDPLVTAKELIDGALSQANSNKFLRSGRAIMHFQRAMIAQQLGQERDRDLSLRRSLLERSDFSRPYTIWSREALSSGETKLAYELATQAWRVALSNSCSPRSLANLAAQAAFRARQYREGLDFLMLSIRSAPLMLTSALDNLPLKMSDFRPRRRPQFRKFSRLMQR